MQSKTIIIATLILYICVNVSCNNIEPSNNNKIDNVRQLSDLGKIMDIDFPSDAEILFSIKHDRNNEVYFNYIILTQQPVDFPSITPRRIKPNSSIEVLKKVGTIGPLGKLIAVLTREHGGWESRLRESQPPRAVGSSTLFWRGAPGQGARRSQHRDSRRRSRRE